MVGVKSTCAVWFAAGIAALAWPALAGAQSLGAKGGVGLSTIVFTNNFAATTPMAPGLVGGGVVGLALPMGLGLRVEGLLAEERATVEGFQEDRFRYLEVPVLVRYRLLGGDRHPIHLTGGAVYRRVLDATETLGDESFSIKEGVHTDDIAMAVGAEIALRSRWSVEVRYLHGRNGIYRRDGGSYAGTRRTIQLTATYAIWH
jgi:hypothetical protein